MGSRVAVGRTPFGLPERSNLAGSAREEATNHGSGGTKEWMIAFTRLVNVAIPLEEVRIVKIVSCVYPE